MPKVCSNTSLAFVPQTSLHENNVSRDGEIYWILSREKGRPRAVGGYNECHESVIYAPEVSKDEKSFERCFLRLGWEQVSSQIESSSLEMLRLFEFWFSKFESLMTLQHLSLKL